MQQPLTAHALHPRIPTKTLHLDNVTSSTIVTTKLLKTRTFWSTKM